jgi:AraC-like DNA-binding protein
MHHIIAIGIFQAFIAAGMLWKGKGKNSADGLLIMFIICIACHLSIKFVIYQFVDDQQVRQQMNTFIGFCYGPLLYLYAKKVRNEQFVPATRWYVFLPLVVAAIAYFAIAGIITYSSASGYRLLAWYNTGSYIGITLSDMVYVMLALRIERRLTGRSNERRIIRLIAWGFTIMVGISTPVYLAATLLDLDLMIPVRTVTYALLSLICVMIVYYKYVAGDVPELVSAVSDTVELPENLQRKTALPDEKQRHIWDSLESQMRQKALFTDCDLNLDKLAALTGINKYHLSETLNSFAGKSFYQYVNEYRVAHVLKQLENRPQGREAEPNFLSLAYQSGFKAKSSFNRYFKEITGLTPSEYLRSTRNVMA